MTTNTLRDKILRRAMNSTGTGNSYSGLRAREFKAHHHRRSAVHRAHMWPVGERTEHQALMGDVSVKAPLARDSGPIKIGSGTLNRGRRRQL